MLGLLELGVAGDRVAQRVGGEDVVAHAREHLVGRVGQADRVGRLLEEGADVLRVGRVDVDDAELVGQRDRLPDRRDRAAGAGLDVVGHHLREVHPVDVVGADHDHDVGLLVGEQVERLVDRVGAAEVPPLAHALLRRHRGDVVAEQVGHPPRRGDVPVEAVRLVLRQHDDLEVAGVDDVGQREVDEAVDAAERHRGFGPVGGQRHQALALTAGEDDGEDLLAGGVGAHASKLVALGRRRPPLSASRFAGMRVDVLSKEYPPEVYGGAGVHVAELVRALRALPDVDARVRCFGAPRSEAGTTAYAEPRLAGRLPTRRSGPSASTSRWSTTAPARTWCTRTRGTPTWPATSPGSCTASRTSSSAHSLEPMRPWKAEQLGGGYAVSSWVERTAYEGAAGIVAVSAAMRDDVLRSYPAVDPAQGARWSTTASTPRCGRRCPTPTGCASSGSTPTGRSVIFVGRITRQKGLPLFLRAVAALPPDVQLILCAGAPDTPEIAAEVRGLVDGLAATRDGVVWIEEMLPRADVVALLTAATVFACPSIYEPLGIVNLEAMACETAVVATATGGIPEVVVARQTGWLVPIEQATDGTGTPARPGAVRRRPGRRPHRRGLAIPTAPAAYGVAGRASARGVLQLGRDRRADARVLPLARLTGRSRRRADIARTRRGARVSAICAWQADQCPRVYAPVDDAGTRTANCAHARAHGRRRRDRALGRAVHPGRPDRGVVAARRRSRAPRRRGRPRRPRALHPADRRRARRGSRTQSTAS